VTVQDWSGMQNAVVGLLLDSTRRHELESTAGIAREKLQWQGRAQQLLALYATLVPGFKVPKIP
jgi:hypothetical protein